MLSNSEDDPLRNAAETSNIIQLFVPLKILFEPYEGSFIAWVPKKNKAFIVNEAAKTFLENISLKGSIEIDNESDNEIVLKLLSAEILSKYPVTSTEKQRKPCGNIHSENRS